MTKIAFRRITTLDVSWNCLMIWHTSFLRWSHLEIISFVWCQRAWNERRLTNKRTETRAPHHQPALFYGRELCETKPGCSPSSALCFYTHRELFEWYKKRRQRGNAHNCDHGVGKRCSLANISAMKYGARARQREEGCRRRGLNFIFILQN